MFAYGIRLSVMGVTLLLSACGTSWFAQRKSNSVIEDTLGIFNGGPIATLATTPERRIVLVNVDKSEGSKPRWKPTAGYRLNWDNRFQRRFWRLGNAAKVSCCSGIRAIGCARCI